MAKDNQEDNTENQDDKSSGGSNTKVIIIAVLAAVLLSGGLVGATLYFVTGMNADEKTADNEGVEDEEIAEEIEPLGPPMYHSLDPKFVVSFRDQRSARFMQFELDVMSRQEDTIKNIEVHNSAIRSNLLMLFDSQNYDVMSSREGKEQLLIAVTQDINKTINKMVGEESEESSVESAYFTSFVIQ